MTPETRAAIRHALEVTVAAGAPGALLAVDAPALGLSCTDAVGLFERDTSRSLRPDDPFRAASVSKAVTAAAVVTLAAQGTWSLDDPVAPFLSPEVARSLTRLTGTELLEAFTFRRLLNHTSGLPDYFFHDRFQARVRAESNRTWRPAELVEAAANIGTLDFAPGTDFSYGDTGYVLAGLAIEQAWNGSLADAYRSLIFSPLRMDATYLEWHEPPVGPPVSHHYDGERDLLPTNTSFDWGGGGLVTTASDLTRFLRGLFDGTLFARSWVAEMTRWGNRVRWRTNSSARYRRYGLGIGMNRAGGEEIIGATGVWGAFAYIWLDAGIAIAGTVNATGLDRTALVGAVIDALQDEAGASSPVSSRIHDVVT